ncbi:MAG: SulP family inorganic anion transporter [Steroidobacteraceae bacterium]
MPAFLVPNFDLTHWRGDLFGGVTAAVVALPLALAFGVAAGAGPVAGLYGAIFVGFFAALFGGTPTQISGPTGPMTVVSAAIFVQFHDQPAAAFTVVMLAGLLQVLLGMLRFGRLINLVPYPVTSGFMSGIGVIIICMQLEPLLGHAVSRNAVAALAHLGDDLRHPVGSAVIVGTVAFIVSMFLPKSIGRIVPATLLALLVGTLLGLFYFHDAPQLGAIPSALPSLHIPVVPFAQLRDVVLSAAVLAILGSIDSLLTSLVADNATRTFHDSDRELVGQGIGNFLAGLGGGLPGAGATIRTLVNIRSGGRTALAGMTHALVLLLLVLGLAPLVAHVPHAVLAGILLKVGIDVIDWPFLRRMPRLPRSATACMLVVLVLTVVIDVITAVAVGLVMASLLFIKELADVQAGAIRALTNAPQEGGILTDAEAAQLAEGAGRIQLLHLAGPMSFGAATEMMRRISNAMQVRVLIVDMTDVPLLDASAALAIESIIAQAAQSGQRVALCGLRPRVAAVIDRLGAGVLADAPRFGARAEALDFALAAAN